MDDPWGEQRDYDARHNAEEMNCLREQIGALQHAQNELFARVDYICECNHLYSVSLTAIEAELRKVKGEQ